jgi:heme exporter protein C
VAETGHARARVGSRPLLGLVASATAVVSLVFSLAVAPPDATQGETQRLMYVHVPAAWVAYLAFLTVLVASMGYVRRRDLRWDRWAQAAAELGVGLTALAIALGSIWGRTTWGVWWTWDARLVTTTILLVVYIGYLGVRGLSDDPAVSARRAAVVGILGFVNVPLVHFSVVWWRTLHQPPTVLAPSSNPPIAPIMGLALALAVLAFTLLGAWVVLRRVDALRAAAASQTGSPAEPHGDRAGHGSLVIRPGSRQGGDLA